MKKAILISIKPEWVEEILNRSKITEIIRRDMPKCDLPIDVYIYCSKGNSYLYYFTDLLNGKVVAKFTLNKVSDISKNYKHESIKNLYAWNIDNLQRFDKPMELSEFYKGNYEYIRDYVDCNNTNCPYAHDNSILGDDGHCDDYDCPYLKVNKPPRSWQYVYVGD